MRWHDGRFARHPTFRFVAFNTLMRSQARTRSKFFVKQHDGTHEALTRERLVQALQHSEDPEAQALINSITRHRQDLEAYAYNLGCPAAFITFSPADLHWRSLYQHMPRYEEWLAASESERMALSRQKKFNVTDYWDRTVPQGEGNPLSADPLGTEMTFLRLSQIVNRCQRHKCNTTYCLRVRKRTGDLARTWRRLLQISRLQMRPIQRGVPL
ncbi:PIF1-like helicase [Hirsutella rhossiliensis]